MDYNSGLGISGIFTKRGHTLQQFSRMNIDCFLFVCKIKLSNHGLLRYPYVSPSLDISSYMHAYAICYRMAGLWQSWTSTVGVCPRLYSNFTEIVHGWKVLTNTHTHTHTHTLPERTGTQHSLVPLKYIMQISNTWLFWILLPLWLLRANSELL